MDNLLVWYWGRKGGGAKYSEMVLRGLESLAPGRVHASFSRQSDVFGAVTRITDLRHDVDTFDSKAGFALRTPLVPAMAWNLARYLKKNSIDRVLTTMGHVWTPLVLPVLRLAGVRHVLTMHDATPHPGDPAVVKLMNRAMVAMSEKVVVLSGHVGREAARHYGIAGDKLIRSRLGLFGYEGLEYSARDFTKGPLRLVFFGRILPYKGLGHLLEAAIEVQKSVPKLEVRVYGSGDAGPYAALLDRVANLRLENRWIDDRDIHELFSEPCVNVAPYVEASQSGTVPVALAAGIPSMVTDVGGLSEQVRHGESGLVLPVEGVAEALAAAIMELDRDRERLNAMSRACGEQARTELDWTVICRDLWRALELT